MARPRRLGREITDAEIDRMLADGHTAISVAKFLEAIREMGYRHNTIMKWCERGWMPYSHKVSNVWVIYPEALRKPRWRFPKKGRPWPQNDETEA